MSSSDEDDGAAWDDWTDNAEVSASCLLCGDSFSPASEAFRHCSEKHGLDLGSLARDSSLDLYQAMKLVNFIRSEVASNKCWNCGDGFDNEEELLRHLDAMRHCSLPVSDRWKDDKYLTPFLPEDPLLYSFEQLDLAADDESDVNIVEGVTSEPDPTEEGVDSSLRELAAMCEKNPEESVVEKTPTKRVSFANIVKDEIRRANRDYFSSYGQYGIHREMLSDKIRTEAYQKAILNNPALLQNAVVMDIGCGTGILSLFAAKAGASKVIAVDGSEKMAFVAREVARDNGFMRDGSTDNSIEVVSGMIEELDEKLPIKPHSVDVIISEWMGYCLLYESMLDSVLHARDRWLKPGGAILPDTAEMFVAGFGKGGTCLPFWEDVYGFSMKHIGAEVLKHATEKPLIDVVDEKHIVTAPFLIQTFDISTMRVEDADFHAEFILKPSKAVPSWCYGIVVWFDVGFTNRFCKDQPVVLTTSPFSTSTHWSQTILTFKEPVLLKSVEEFEEPGKSAARIEGRISIARSSKHRSIDISLETTILASNGTTSAMPVQLFEI